MSARYVEEFARKRNTEEKLNYVSEVLEKLAADDVCEDDAHDVDGFLEQVQDELDGLAVAVASHEGLLSAMVTVVKLFRAAVTPAPAGAAVNIMVHDTYEKVVYSVAKYPLLETPPQSQSRCHRLYTIHAFSCISAVPCRWSCSSRPSSKLGPVCAPWWTHWSERNFWCP
jgi:hypothetical protein